MLKRAHLSRAVLSRDASYSKTPLKKTGAFGDVIHNDAIFKGRAHLLDAKAIAAPASWKLTAGDLKNTKSKIDEEQFPIPEHRYNFHARPFFGFRGAYVGQRIEYDEILPRCKGKLSGLEWKGLTEEDRYTARNWYIRAHNKNIRESSHYQYKNFTQGERGSYFFLLAFSISMWLLVNQGLPWENNRIWMSGSPDNQAEIGTKPSTIMQFPILGDILLFFVNGQFHRNDWGADQYRYPLWTERDGGIDPVADRDLLKRRELVDVTPLGLWEVRENGKVKSTPSAAFRTEHELYADGAEGPSQIGPYDVSTWKSGEKINSAHEGVGHSSQSFIFSTGQGAAYHSRG